MKRNVGRTEQIVRIILGLGIILLGFYYSSWWGIIGLAPLITGLIRYCPISDAFGISTYRAKRTY